MKGLNSRNHAAAAAAAAAAAVLLAVVGAGGYAVADSASDSGHGGISQVKTGGSSRFARAYGLDPAIAAEVFTLRNGQRVAVVADGAAACLIRGPVGHGGETCSSRAEINEGRAISVLDECGTESRDLMEITGLAPEGASSVRLMWSDGHSDRTPVTDGAFRFEGANPAPGGRYPTGVAWTNAAGADLGIGVFPVQGDQFCLPAS